MDLAFDFSNIGTTEFGVGRDNKDDESFWFVPVDDRVQGALRDMAAATWHAMKDIASAPVRYEPSEKHATTEYLYLPLADDMARRMRELHQANNLSIGANALSDPGPVFCYFARLTDDKRRRLTALRRATQFKGSLKSRFVRLFSDALELVEDRVFKLDNDFDLLVDSQCVFILRPSGFEYAGNLKEAILSAVPQNISSIEKCLPFVDLTGIQEYAGKHPRAARLLASIQAQRGAGTIDKDALNQLCEATGVELQASDGKIAVPADQVMGFLEVLDRRRYDLELVRGSHERYKAASRQRIGG
jgi:hypothetical protein